MASFTTQTYTPTEEAEIQQWLTTSDRLKSPEDKSTILETLNSHLSSRTTLLGSKPSKADVAIYETLAPVVSQWTPEQRTGEKGHPHIVRHLDFVQNSALFGLDVQKFQVDQDNVLYVKPPVDAKAEKERLKKEKAAAAATGGEASLVDRTKEKVKEKVAEAKEIVAGGDQPKKAKKEKAPKAQKVAAPAAPLSPALIDLRVGHILKAVNHPDADSLYVSTIAVGDTAGDDYTEPQGRRRV
ncbi:hypothetical protein G7046_g8461 [Stylonectria norvegica]|nr:hypothetical protein G7046_g8461 [Stylonectria norvegica]